MAKDTLRKTERAAQELWQLLDALCAEREQGIRFAGHELQRLESTIENCATHPALADAGMFSGPDHSEDM